MGYQLKDLEITRPLSAIRLTVDEDGVGILVRKNSRPVGFLMKAASRGSVISVEALELWLAEELKEKLLAEAIREELGTDPPRTPPPSFTVAICTHARPAQLDRCLQSLLGLQLLHRFEILVVDNASPDSGVADVARRYGSVRYTQENRPGLDFARNRAWKEATGDWVAYLDDDVVVDAGWFDGLCEALRENPDAACVTGLVSPLFLNTEAQVIFEHRGGFRRGFEKRRFRSRLPGNNSYPCGSGVFGTGANMAFRRKFLRMLGGFDEALDTGAPLPGGGDLDIFYRVIHEGGILVYEPRFLVFHEHRTSLKGLRKQYYTWGLGLMAYIRKHVKADASQRSRFLRLVKWWIRDELQQLRNALRGRGEVPPVMILAEILGAIVGWAGEYERSCRRIDTIKRMAP